MSRVFISKGTGAGITSSRTIIALHMSTLDTAAKVGSRE
jgi:hypothetical protein